MRPATGLAALAALLAVAAVTLATGERATPLPERPATTPSPPRVTAAQVSSQHAEPGPARPLLEHLPLRLGGVAIEIAGLAPGGRPVLSIDQGRRDRAHAQRVVERALAVYGDTAGGYVLHWHGAPPAASPPATTADPVLSAARDYVLAARNWSDATRALARRRQLRLATSALRRALLRRAAVPPRSDRVSSVATIERMRRLATASDATARVLVWLDERVELGGAVTARMTRNEVRLRRQHGRWRVASWTVLP